MRPDRRRGGPRVVSVQRPENPVAVPGCGTLERDAGLIDGDHLVSGGHAGDGSQQADDTAASYRDPHGTSLSLGLCTRH